MTDTMKFRTILRSGGLVSNTKKTEIRDTVFTTWLWIKRRIKAGALSIVFLMTIVCACQAGAQAAKFTTPRSSTAEDVSAQLIENGNSSSHPNPQTVKE